MELMGCSKVDDFHIDCAKCKESVDVTRVWFDGVPNIEVECKKCEEKDAFKLMAGHWAGLIKVLHSNG